MTTPTGRALAGMLAVFAEFEREILRERVKAGIVQARIKEQPSPDLNGAKTFMRFKLSEIDAAIRGAYDQK
jgi:DNA invertase Pin-like site-specific DNA recombinase